MADDAFDFEALVSGGYPLQRFEPEQRIFTQDDEGAAMYVVRSGKVAIMAGRGGAGEHWPEWHFRRDGADRAARRAVPRPSPASRPR